MDVEVIEHAIEVGTWCAVVLHLSSSTFRVLMGQVHQDRLLSQIALFVLLAKGVIVVAVSIYVVRIQLETVLLGLDLEVPATCGIWITLTRSIPIRLDLRVDKGSIQKILDLVPKNRRELHHTIPNHHSLEVYGRGSVQIIPIDQHSEVRNVLASI